MGGFSPKGFGARVNHSMAIIVIMVNSHAGSLLSFFLMVDSFNYPCFVLIFLLSDTASRVSVPSVAE